MVLDARGIEAFFSVVGRTVSDAELRYYLTTFDKDAPAAGASLVSVAAGPSHDQYVRATRKWRRALWISRVLRIFPWVHGIAIVNSLAMGSTNEDSDIDLLVLCAPRRVWLSRFTVVSTLRLLRLRPGETAHDPVCPSFFLAPDAYDLRAIAIDDDVYLRFWLATVSPVWGSEAFASFFAANTWAVQRDTAELSATPAWYTRAARRALMLLSSNLLEVWLRRLQMRLLPLAIHAKAARNDHGVILTDSMLKFHEEDGRAVYRDRWKADYGSHQ